LWIFQKKFAVVSWLSLRAYPGHGRWGIPNLWQRGVESGILSATLSATFIPLWLRTPDTR
jgi:hypothetical protein